MSPEQPSIAEDSVVDAWRNVIRPAQEAGARVMVQMNHGGVSADSDVVPERVSPSGSDTGEQGAPRALTDDDVDELIDAYGKAALRAKAAGFDGVQIHGAHGYLMSQFLTPATNVREDNWGGDADRRFAFLGSVIAEIRRHVGPSYPVWIKLGVAGAARHGYGIKDGADVARRCSRMGVDCIEISHAFGAPEGTRYDDEPPYLPMAKVVRQEVGAEYPLALVNGFSALRQMEGVLSSGVAQLISLSRPLICEPDLPRKLRTGVTDVAACARCDECWPRNPGEGVACHNEDVQAAL
jgi:2,4-dienoyl-CoA reductase-like NADH-dependent reductase (Old Yellow Enzyme family)